MIAELLLILLFLSGVLILIHRHLLSEREAFFSLTRQYLDSLSTLIPTQTREVGRAIVEVVSPVVKYEEVANPPTPMPDQDSLDEEPFIPPWEVEVDPGSVSKLGEWK